MKTTGPPLHRHTAPGGDTRTGGVRRYGTVPGLPQTPILPERTDLGPTTQWDMIGDGRDSERKTYSSFSTTRSQSQKTANRPRPPGTRPPLTHPYLTSGPGKAPLGSPRRWVPAGRDKRRVSTLRVCNRGHGGGWCVPRVEWAQTLFLRTSPTQCDRPRLPTEVGKNETQDVTRSRDYQDVGKGVTFSPSPP